MQNGPAAQAGLRPGDVIRAVNGKAVSTVPELLSTVAALKPGDTAELRVIRRQEESTLKIIPGRRNAMRRRE
jgi:S1-C subfamily serine protease